MVAVGPCYPECVCECVLCVWCSTYRAVSLSEFLKACNKSLKSRFAFAYTNVIISPLPVSYHSTASQKQNLIHMGDISSCFRVIIYFFLVFWNHPAIFFYFFSVEARSFVNSYWKSADPARSEFHGTNCWSCFNISFNFDLYGVFPLEKEEETN